jgi:hypothetical protein
MDGLARPIEHRAAPSGAGLDDNAALVYETDRHRSRPLALGLRIFVLDDVRAPRSNEKEDLAV